MEENSSYIFERVLRDMSEGVMVVNLKGIISSLNPAAEEILGLKAGNVLGKSFVKCFFEYEQNDSFNQLILDAIYDSAAVHQGIVPYYDGEAEKQLRVTTSYLGGKEARTALIAVLSDISELSELRDAVKAMERIRMLNEKLQMRNKLLNETFGRFLSDEIVKQILDTPEGLTLGGQKHHLTMMMSDLRGFTALSETMEPQKLLEMLNHYLGTMADIIQECKGTIIEFIGDGIMAIFGAPVACRNHAEMAVTAGIRMQHTMESINRWNEEHGFPILEMGIGINTGDVIVGNIGSERRTKYGVTGSCVNVCGRIESYTVGGQVLISSSTLNEIEVPVEKKSSFQAKPKGEDHFITIYNVVGLGTSGELTLIDDTAPALRLVRPVFLPFRTIKEKHTTTIPMGGQIIALSRDNAIFVTLLELQPYDNIEIDIGEPLFAKVLTVNKHEKALRFTARPPCFEEFLKKQEYEE